MIHIKHVVIIVTPDTDDQFEPDLSPNTLCSIRNIKNLRVLHNKGPFIYYAILFGPLHHSPPPPCSSKMIKWLTPPLPPILSRNIWMEFATF